MKTSIEYIHIIIRLFVMILIIAAGVNVPVIISNAGEMAVSDIPEAVKEQESGVVKLLVYAVDQNGNEYNVKQGTGILFGTNNGEKMVLTNDKLVQADADLLNNIRRQFGLSTEGDLNIQTDIVLPVGTRIKTEAGSTGNDFVILNLASDISNINSLKLGNSSVVKENDKLYILEYGGNSDILGQSEVGNLELQESTALVVSATEEEIITDYQLENGKAGTPVMNADGYVVGIFTMRDTGLYIKPIDRVKDVLDVLNILYQGVESDNHYNEVTDEIENELNKVLLECEELVMKDEEYTKKSVKKLKSVISEAISVTTNAEATYDDYESAIEELNKYKKKLRKKEYPIQMVQIFMGVVILIFIVLGIRTRIQIKKIKSENNIDSEGKAEKNAVIYAKLIRLDTMREIPIPNVIFRIGKNVGDIDYVIENNTSISRHHADIMRKGNEFFILDNNSTNHTYVNDKQAMPGEYVPIKSGDIIRLSDVSFRFEV